MRNAQQTILASAARTADSDTQVSHSGIGGKIIIDVTATAATPSVVFTVQGIDPASGKAFTILASAAKTGTGTTVLTIHPFATASANVAVNDFLPENFNINANHADGDSITYSVGFISFGC